MLKYDPKSRILPWLLMILCVCVVVCGTAGAVYLSWRIHWVLAVVAAVPVWILLVDLLVNSGHSLTWYFLDFIRHIIAFGGTAVAVWFVWDIDWRLGVIAILPIFVLLLNLVGFLTLRLYWSDLTPEGRTARKAGRKLDELKRELDEVKRDSKQ